MMLNFLSAGDTALTVEFGDSADTTLSAKVLALDRKLASASLRGVVEIVPALCSLTLYYRPAQTSAEVLKAQLEPLCVALDEVILAGRRWRLPVQYGGGHGPDLAEIAHAAGLSPQAAASLHASLDYRIYMVGFLPGQPYMGDLPPGLQRPRRDTPRIAVPAGSVAIATTMTVIYPWESPGGWHIIGCTPVPLFDAGWTPPALLAAGDVVSFEMIGADELATLQGRATRGEWRPEAHSEPAPVRR